MVAAIVVIGSVGAAYCIFFAVAMTAFLRDD